MRSKSVLYCAVSSLLALGLLLSPVSITVAAAEEQVSVPQEQVPLGVPSNVKKGQLLYATKVATLFKTMSTKGNKVASIKAFDRVSVVKNNGSWVQVKAGSKTGYVQSKLFSVTYKAQTNGQITTIKKAALKQSASAGAKTLANVPAKKKLNIAKVSGKWIQVIYNGQTGFIDEKSYVVTAEPKTAQANAKSASAGTTSAATPSTSDLDDRGTATNIAGTQKQAELSDKTTADIDPSEAARGLVQVKILSHTGKTLKFMMRKQDTVYLSCPAIAAASNYSLTMGDGQYSSAVLENISGNQYSYVQQAEFTAGSSDDKYLASTPNIYYTDEMAPIKKAAQLCAGKTTDSQKVKAIFDWVTKNVSYDSAKTLVSGSTSSVEETYSIGKGVCKDFAVLFAAMCRSQGIKTKYMTGYCKPVSNYTVYHAWNQVYVDGQWRTTDTSTSSINGQSMFVSSGYSATTEE